MRYSVIASIFGLTTSVLASPTPLQGRAIASDLLSNLEFFAQYAGASYCTNNDNSTGDAVECDDDVCPTVESDSTVTVLEFDEELLTDEDGFVAVDSTAKLIVVSYRGSSSIRNYVDDILFTKSGCDFGSGCEAHAGFLAAFDATKDDVIAAVDTAVNANPSYSLIVTGHSLGGAVATLAAATLRDAGYPCALYTYGSPRVFNDVGANYVTAQEGGNYRVTHYDDPVPRLAPILFGYHHISPEYWLASGPATTTAYSTTGVVICTGISNTTCNAGESGFDTTAHSYYFEGISACAPTLGFKRDISERSISDDQISNLMAIDIVYANAWNAANGSTS